MLSSSPLKIHEPRVTGVSPRPRTGDSARKLRNTRAYQWDPYPFILLNLAFSTQAAYAAPLILLAQNRQDDRDRVSLEEDRSRAARTKADTEYLARELAALRLAIGEVATRDYLRSEIDRITERLDELAARAPAKSGRRRT
jgi:uncharacterized membrane protein